MFFHLEEEEEEEEEIRSKIYGDAQEEDFWTVKTCDDYMIWYPQRPPDRSPGWCWSIQDEKEGSRFAKKYVQYNAALSLLGFPVIFSAIAAKIQSEYKAPE